MKSDTDHLLRLLFVAINLRVFVELPSDFCDQRDREEYAPRAREA